MINIHHLIKYPDLYRLEYTKRDIPNNPVHQIIELYTTQKSLGEKIDTIRNKKNLFNSEIATLSGNEKESRLLQMKHLSKQEKKLAQEHNTISLQLNRLITGVPMLSSNKTPIGKDDSENIVIDTFGKDREYNFIPKPYRQLPVYQREVGQKQGVQAMGRRGYYLVGQIAKLQRVLFEYAYEKILQHGYQEIYTPLMLNENVLTGTGHLPDFDGQQYEVSINEHTSYYLIGSSEPSIVGYYMNQNLGSLETPTRLVCKSSCFRKEAGSYGKDQQGILRVHQFEKIEMVVLCRAEDAESEFERHASINENIWEDLGLHFQKVECCAGDMPKKHHRQQDYNAWFPATQERREIGSNGNAADYQNRGLNITHTNNEGNKSYAYGLNDTGMTFRTGLAILEQNQQSDGSVYVPNVLQEKFGSEYLL